MEWILILEKAAWCGVAAVGFALLFNVPPRTLLCIWILGVLGGFTKFILVKAGANLILATLGGSALIGILSIQAAHFRHAPPLVFSIPAVIPMVPGVLAYRTMLGLIFLSGTPGSELYSQVLCETVSKGVNTFFIVLSLSLGGSLPFLLTRKESAKNIKLLRRS